MCVQENARLLELSVEARAEVLALQEELEEAREGVEGVAREVAETRRLGGGQVRRGGHPGNVIRNTGSSVINDIHTVQATRK